MIRAIELMLRLPQVWLVLVATGIALVTNYWEPLVDIVDFAMRRLSS